MLRRPLLVVALLFAVAALPTSQAAINGPRPFTAQYDYMPELDAAEFIMVSGAVEATMASAGGTFGLFDIGGADITGLTRVCWVQTIRQCADSAGGNLHLVVQPGGSFGMRLPPGVEARLAGDHALAMFADLGGEVNLNSLGLGKSMLAPLVSGTVRLEGIPPIPVSTTNDLQGDGAGLLTATDATTVIEVRDGGTVRATLRGKADPILFAGEPELAPVACNLAVLPFQGTGAVARFERAGKAAAREGLDIQRINGLMDGLYQANQGAPTESTPVDANAFGPYEDAAAALFGGAVLRLPTQDAVGTEIGFARTTRLEVRGTSGDGLAWSGRATFEIRDGHVTGAKDLAGSSFLQMPWWSWVLWLAAIGVWVTRLVLKPERHHALWDRFKWVGWVVSPLVFLLVFWLWDLELRALLGLSMFSGTGGGQVLLFVGALQVGTFFLASFAAMAPLRMLMRNGSLLLRQGTFMGLAGAVAGLLGFLFIATYLRAYLDLILSQVLAGIA